MRVYPAQFQMLESYIGKHADQFAGAYVDRASHTVHINLTAASSPAAEGLATELAAKSGTTGRVPAGARGRPYPVAVRVVRYSQRELDRTKAEVTSLQPWVSLVRPVLATWGSDPITDTVTVGLTKLTPELKAAARAAFGGRVTLVQRQRPELAVKVTKLRRGYRVVHIPRRAGSKGRSRVLVSGAAPQPSRLIDEVPYYGGDRIYQLVSGSGGTTTIIQCTTGFAFTTPAMSTAGHCGAPGSAWTQGYYDKSANILYNAGYIGSAFSVQWGNQRPDFALLNNAASTSTSLWYPFIYTALQTSALVGSYNKLIPMLNSPVCVDGSFTGENCNGIVTAANQSVIVNDNGTNVTVWYADQVSTVSTDGSRVCNLGDSGGPVYTRTGTTSGVATVNAVGSVVSCNVGTPSQPGPGNTVWLADISVMVPLMGAGPVWTVPQQP
jgi:hypothetical protein